MRDLIVPTLRAHRYTQVAMSIWCEHDFGSVSGLVRENWYIRRRCSA
ncbi:hypothetical protein [Pseudomonas viridiflava]|nr:hypothetical protein [Pseudomonas viridiflava]